MKLSIANFCICNGCCRAPGLVGHRAVANPSVAAGAHLGKSAWGRRLLRSKSMADEHSEWDGMKVLRLYAELI